MAMLPSPVVDEPLASTVIPCGSLAPPTGIATLGNHWDPPMIATRGGLIDRRP